MNQILVQTNQQTQEIELEDNRMAIPIRWKFHSQQSSTFRDKPEICTKKIYAAHITIMMQLIFISELIKL